MSYNSKRTIVSMVLGVVVTIAYAFYALGENAPKLEDVKSWATVMLAFIGVGVAATVVAQVIFHIASAIGIAAREGEGEKIDRIISSSMVEDEMGKLISLKSTRFTLALVGTSFIAALVALACGVATVVALHALFAGFAIGSLVEGAANVYYNEKGVHNG